ncbi:MAG: hypothetical protein ACI391_02090, partial [Muribaculaceae bacterium]
GANENIAPPAHQSRSAATIPRVERVPSSITPQCPRRRSRSAATITRVERVPTFPVQHSASTPRCVSNNSV